jgi:BON domain-containing protein
MKFKILGLITAAILAVTFTGCESANNNTHTANANTNANANANVNTNANTTVNANTSNDNRRAPTKEEYERDKARYQREARESGRTVGTGLNDGWLWVKTRFDLAAVDDLRDSTINVDVDNAVVTLSGTVANAAQKAKAEQTVKTVEGVKSVKNMLKVSASTNTNSANKNAANRNR